MAKLYDDIPDYDKDFHKKKKVGAPSRTFTGTPKPLEKHGAKVSVISLTLSAGQSGYYNSAALHNKDLIVLHHTACTHGKVKGDIGELTKHKADAEDRVSVAYVLARDGNIYRLFDDKYWSQHLGPGALGGNPAGSKRSVAIEISNVGFLGRRNAPNQNQLETLDDDGNGVYHYCDLTDNKAYVKLKK
ncbi:N-acetylmuramoyl-L-alanine amidase, partial [bacterium]|nr:N-acetylmuramoyl-L-alanine amidase [bacterium]